MITIDTEDTVATVALGELLAALSDPSSVQVAAHDSNLRHWLEIEGGAPVAEVRKVAAARGWTVTVDGETLVLHTVEDADGRALVPESIPPHLVSLEALPTTRLTVMYRGLLVEETDWRLADLDDGAGSTRGQPKVGAHPIRRITYTWTMDPVTGPVVRNASAAYLSTDGDDAITIPWTPKPYGMPATAAPNGQANSTDAGSVRRRNVMVRLHRLGAQGIATHIQTILGGGGVPLAIDVYAAELIGILEPLRGAYEQGGGAALTAAITAAAGSANPKLAWLGVSMDAERLVSGSMQSVTATCAEHMLDELVEPS